MDTYKTNKTLQFVAKLNKLQLICGLSPSGIDNNKSKCFSCFNQICYIVLYVFIVSEYGSFFTQVNLSEKQASDQIVFAVSHPVIMTYSLNAIYYSKRINKLLFMLAIGLKNSYNDLKIEKEMIRKATLYSIFNMMTISAALFFYGFDGMIQVLKSDGTFTTVITVWPDVKEKGFLPDMARIGAYIVWWIFMLKCSAVDVLVISLIIIISHQYRNLQSYFYNLENIFNTNNTPEEKERQYEKSLKTGIFLHSETMWCVKECERICSLVFSGQIIINFSVFCLLMLQMVNSERTLMNTLATISTSFALLVSTGVFMWNAGDITVEASILPTAILHSGWHHCRGKSAFRVRNLVAIAIAQSQKPVIVRSFKIIELSYSSYVSIVKSSYSVFSILY